MSHATQQDHGNIATECEVVAVGARLRALREQAGLTQSEVAFLLDTTQSAVARMEAGRQRLSLSRLREAAIALGCDVQLIIVGRKEAS